MVTGDKKPMALVTPDVALRYDPKTYGPLVAAAKAKAVAPKPKPAAAASKSPARK